LGEARTEAAASLGKVPPNYREQRSDEPLARHERTGAVVLAASVVIVGAGFGIWAAAGGGASGAKPEGPCVSFSVASSTGGAQITHCGKGVRAWCATEAAADNGFGYAAEAACRRAGLLGSDNANHVYG